MPLKLNVGLSKKVGLPDYGSIGASVHLELELDSGAVAEPERLRQQIRHLFGMAKTSVEAELISQQPGSHNRNGQDRERLDRNNNGFAAPQSDHNRRTNGRTATQSQIRAINAIANRQRLDLVPQLQKLGVRAVEDLGIQQASQLIDDLKSQRAGTGDNR